LQCRSSNIARAERRPTRAPERKWQRGSSDTRYSHNVIKYGAGADLLVHEVASAPPELMKEPYIQRIIGHHTTPREAGRVFAQTKPKLAAYTHLVLIGSEQVLPPDNR
jgi:ribonuclease Z